MRCNVGVNPKYLTDQWLIAEYRELPMVVGSLRINDWSIKSPVKTVFDLGTGHINWFKWRLHYLHRRHIEVKKEMVQRNFKCDVLNIVQSEIPFKFWNDWNPTLVDSEKIRERLVQKLIANKLPITWWRYNRVNLTAESAYLFIHKIRTGELFFV